MINKKILNLLISFALIIGLILFFIFSQITTEKNVKSMFGVLYLSFLLILLFVFLNGFKKHITLLVFLISFFTFLMSNKLFVPEKATFSMFTSINLDIFEYNTFLQLLYYSVIFTFFSYRISNTFKRKVKPFNPNLHENHFSLNLKYIIKILLPSIAIIAIIEAFLNYRYVGIVGYVGTYINPNMLINLIGKPVSYLPSLVIILLALNPSRTEVKTGIKYYFLYSFCTIFTGRRGEFVIGLLFIFWYLIVIDHQGIFKKKFLNNKRLFITAVISLCLMIFSVQFAFIRLDLQIRSFSLIDYFTYFFKSLGRSDAVIANTIVFKDDLPKEGYNYFIYPIKDIFTQNIVTRTIINSTTNVNLNTTVGQGTSKLILTDSYSHWITFLVSPNYYIRGYGMGTSYVAETFIAFGFVGIFIVSTLIGLIIKRLSEFKETSFWNKILIMIFFRSLVFMPRGPVLGFVDSLYELIIAYLFLYFITILVFTNRKVVTTYARN